MGHAPVPIKAHFPQLTGRGRMARIRFAVQANSYNFRSCFHTVWGEWYGHESLGRGNNEVVSSPTANKLSCLEDTFLKGLNITDDISDLFSFSTASCYPVYIGIWFDFIFDCFLHPCDLETIHGANVKYTRSSRCFKRIQDNNSLLKYHTIIPRGKESRNWQMDRN